MLTRRVLLKDGARVTIDGDDGEVFTVQGDVVECDPVNPCLATLKGQDGIVFICCVDIICPVERVDTPC